MPDAPQDPRLLEIWSQNRVPVIYRRARPNPVLVRLPYAVDNFEWLRSERRNKPQWNRQYRCWETPVAWFDGLVEACLRRFGRVYLVQLHHERQQCAPACWDARGFHCECSCMGANHGAGHPGNAWHEVSETFALSWGPARYACRLVVSTPSPGA